MGSFNSGSESSTGSESSHIIYIWPIVVIALADCNNRQMSSALKKTSCSKLWSVRCCKPLKFSCQLCLEQDCLFREVLGSNLPLPAVTEVTLGSHSSGSLTIPRCKIGTRSWLGNSELTLRIIVHKQEQSIGNDGFTLALKPMGTVNQSPK